MWQRFCPKASNEETFICYKLFTSIFKNVLMSWYQLCRKDWRRNTIRKSTRPRVLNAIIVIKVFFQKGPYQIANLWEVIGCSLGSFIHPSIRDRPRGWSNFLVDFLFLASCSVLSQSELLDVLYLADPNSVFSRWKKGLGESPRSATLGCLSGSFF